MVLESGNLVSPARTQDTEIKFRAGARAFKYIGYSAVGVGAIDVQWGDTYYRVLKDNSVPVLQVDTEAHDGASPYRIMDVGGLRVGVVSFGAVPVERKNSFDLLKLRYEALRDARSNSDILILLDQANLATPAWLERCEKHFGSPDLVIGGTPRMAMTEPKRVGAAMIVPTSAQGTTVGCVDIEVAGGEKKLTFSRKLMDESIKDDPEAAKIVKSRE